MENCLYELKLSYRKTQKLKHHRPVRSSEEAYEVLRSVFDHDLIEAREEFIVLYLNRSNSIIGYFKAFQGGVSSVVVDIKLIMSAGLKVLASGIILAHNHPSGTITPSEQDIRLTRRVREACSLLEMELLDHLIITADNGFFSFADDGKL